MNINPRVKDIEVSLIRKIAIKSKEYKDVINLTIGEPDLPVPFQIVDETTSYMKNNRMGYPPLGGLLELREEITKFYKKHHNTLYNLDEVLVTAGAAEAISTVLKTILEVGDEVLVPLPFYPGYLPNITLNGAIPVLIDTKDNNFQLTVELLESYITPKTKAILLNYPNNPSGVILSKENLNSIMEFLRDKNIYIIADEIYSQLNFNDDFVSVGIYDFLKEYTIIINGFSKSHSMTGWRVGYILSSKTLIKEIIKVHQYSVTSPSIISEYGGYIALSKCLDVSRSYRNEYQKRSNYIYNRLVDMDIITTKPSGSLYVFGSLENYNISSSLDFSYDLLDKKQVAIVPGLAFGTEGFFRVSCTLPLEKLEVAMDKLEEYLVDKK